MIHSHFLCSLLVSTLVDSRYQRMEFIFLTLVILKGWVEKGFMSQSFFHATRLLKNEKLFPSTMMGKKSKLMVIPIHWCQLLPCSQDHLGISHKVTMTLGAQGLRWKRGCMSSWVGAPFLRPQGAHLPRHHFEPSRQMALLPEPSNDSSHNSNTATSIFPPTKLLCLVYWLYNKNKRRHLTIKQSVSECMECQPGWKK